jgi:hypothetical protein
MEEKRACEERRGQLVEKLKNEGIHRSQWRFGVYNRTLCPVVLWHFMIPRIIVFHSLFFSFHRVFRWISESIGFWIEDIKNLISIIFLSV